MSWQWQLSGDLDLTVEAGLYDLDALDTEMQTVRWLQAQGKKVICYLSVGSFENWRPDEDRFPPEVMGKNYAGWSGERWLDIRQLDLLGPIIADRLDLCKAKGFDAVEPDNSDAFQNDTGFPLSAGWLRRPTAGTCPSG